ncbi:MAG: exopolysaccharide biosynthesis protein [Notoacmeibacter sp.]
MRDRIKRATQRRRPLSHVLIEFYRNEPMPTTFAHFRDALADRGLAALLLLVSAFNMLPLPPGTSLLSGIPCLLLAWQMMLRRKAVWLPQRVLNQVVTEDTVKMVRLKVVPKLFWIEKFIKPRYWPLSPGNDEFAIGVVCIVMSVLLILPIPLGNWTSAISMTVLALALLQRDGLFLLIGFIASILTLTICSLVVGGLVFAAERALRGDLPHFVKDFLGMAGG